MMEHERSLRVEKAPKGGSTYNVVLSNPDATLKVTKTRDEAIAFCTGFYMGAHRYASGPMDELLSNIIEIHYTEELPEIKDVHREARGVLTSAREGKTP